MLKDVRKMIKRCVVCKKAKSKENAYELYMLLPIPKHLLMNIVARSHRDVVGNGRGFFRASWWGVVLEMFLDLIIKFWLIFKSRHLVLWSLETYGLRVSG